MTSFRTFTRQHQSKIKREKQIKLRKHLNADVLIKKTVKGGFAGIKDHRTENVGISLTDTLMSGFAMFSLKDPSLLAFDERRVASPSNLMTIYGIGKIPCDTSMREILDGV